jgi:hypothetical protein
MSNGRYRVRNQHLLKDNRASAERQLRHLLRSIPDDVRAEYHSQLARYLDLGMISRIDPSDQLMGSTIFYMPHRPVIRREKENWMRIVFNASARNGPHPSLNDVLYIGTNVFPSVMDNLLHFRLHKVAFVGDLEKGISTTGGQST